MSLYSRNRTLSKKSEMQKIIGDRLFYEMFFRKGMKILDVGCSTGTFVMNDPKNIIGVDADKDAIEIARKNKLNCRHHDANSKKFPFKDNTFDVINCKSILAHIPNSLFFMKEMRRVLKPKGRLVVFTANIKILQFRFFQDYTHFRPFTKESLEHLLFDAGFREYKVYNLPTAMFGMGFLYRHKLLTAERVKSIERFAVNLPILSRLFILFDKRVNLLGEAYK